MLLATVWTVSFDRLSRSLIVLRSGNGNNSITNVFDAINVPSITSTARASGGKGPMSDPVLRWRATRHRDTSRRLGKTRQDALPEGRGPEAP